MINLKLKNFCYTNLTLKGELPMTQESYAEQLSAIYSWWSSLDSKFLEREKGPPYIYTNNKYILIWKWWSVLTSDWRGGKDMKKVKVHYEYEEKKEEEFCNINVSLVSSSNISWKWRWWLLWMSCCCISSINDWLMFKRGLGNHCRRTHKSRLQMLIYIFVGWAFTHKLDITQ